MTRKFLCQNINVSWGWNRRIKGSLLEAGLYLLLRSLMLVDPFERRLALEKLMLGNMTMERSADRQRRQTCGKGQERELHPDDLLKQKKTGPLLEDWPKGLALGQELWLWWGLEHTRQWGLASPEKVAVQSSISTWSQLMRKSFMTWRGKCSSRSSQAPYR